MSAKFYQAKKILLEERRAGTLVNAAGRRAAKTVLLMDNGTVVASCYTMARLLSYIAKSDAKGTDSTTIPKGNNVRLYIADVEAIGPDKELVKAKAENIDDIIADTLAEDEEDEDIVLDDEEVSDE